MVSGKKGIRFKINKKKITINLREKKYSSFLVNFCRKKKTFEKIETPKM